MRLWTLLLIFTLAIPTVAEELTTDGNYLLQSCQMDVRFADKVSRTEDTNFRAGVCSGVVEAVANISYRVCPPLHATNMQAVRVVVKYLEKHPETLNLSDGVLTERALSEAFPCKPENSRK